MPATIGSILDSKGEFHVGGKDARPAAPQAHPLTTGFNSIQLILLSLFIFAAPAMPMPSKGVLGFISPALVALLGLFTLYNVIARRPIMISTRYTTSILTCYLFLCMSDLFCILLFGFADQAPYIIARTATVILFITAIAYEPSLARIEAMVRIYCWSIGLLSILVILEGFGFVTMEDPNAVSLQGRMYFGARMPFKKAVGFPMSDGEFGIMVVPAFLYCLMQVMGGAHVKPMRFAGLLTLLSFAGLIIAQSRSTWLGLAFALPLVLFLFPRKNLDRWLLVLAGIAFAVLVGSQVYAPILEGMVSEGVLAKNASGRFTGFAIALDMAKDSPIYGFGHGAQVSFKSSHDDGGIIIHNHFIDAVTSGGLIAFIPTVALYVIAISKMLSLSQAGGTDPVIRVLAICILGSLTLAVVELFFYRGFYSEHLPWLIGTSCLLVALQTGEWRVLRA